MKKTYIKQAGIKIVLVAFFLILTFLFVGCAKTEDEDIFRFEVREIKIIVGDKNNLKIVYGSINEGEVVVQTSDSSILEISKTTINVGESVEVTGIKEGKVTLSIYVKGQENIKDTINVIVEKEYVTSIHITCDKEVLEVADTVQMKANVFPEDIDDSIIWSVDKPEVATISETGLLTAASVGEVIVSAKSSYDNTMIATKKLTVKYDDSIDISVLETVVTLTHGGEYQLNPVVLPNEYPNIANQKVTYKVDGTAKVISVDDQGKVTTLTAGTQDVVIESVDGITKIVTFTVEFAQSTDIVLEKTEVDLIAGGSYSIKPVVLPNEAPTIANQKVTYVKNGEEEIISVNASGVVKALAEGTQSVTVSTENGISKTITFTVTYAPSTGIDVEDEKVTIKVNEEYQIVAKVTPDKGTSIANPALTYTIIADKGIITVDDQGKVTAVNTGTQKVLISTVDGVTVEIEITVESDTE